MVRQSGINAAEKDISKIKFLTIIMNVGLPAIEEARNKKTSEYLKAYIRNMLEPSLKRMSGYLNVVIGGKAILNSNLCTSKGLANGTGCRVVEVELTPDAVIRQRNIHGTNLYVPCVYAHEVEALICEHVLPRYKKKQLENDLPVGQFRVPQFSTSKIIPWKNDISVKLIGFQVSANWACTGHKTQGKTLKKVMIGILKGHTFNSSGWLYVLLSRARQLSDVYLVKKLSTLMDKYLPRTKIINEHARLDKLHLATKQKVASFFN